MLFELFLRRLIRQGDLTVVRPNGKTFHIAGAPFDRLPPETRPKPVCLVFTDPKVIRHLPWQPALAFGEGYMDGTIRVEDGSLHDLLALFMINLERSQANPLSRTRNGINRLIRRLHQNNPVPRSIKNVAHHCDLSPRLYELFLDADRQYSCAHFPTGAETLEEAQAAKKRHIASKLLLRPGQTVLDIGCGWGGTALYLAKTFDVSVTGITLSEPQLAVARARAEAAGLTDRVKFELMDYRAVKGRFDRAFFRTVHHCLANDGVALLHTIGRTEPPGSTNAWIRKYIFPSGYCPALSKTMAAVERERLITTDVEILRLHYAETLRHWHDRFQSNRAEIAAMFDERFCRMWEFYLLGTEMAFRYEGEVVFQIQMTRSKTAVPETRDYIAAFEAAHPLPPH